MEYNEENSIVADEEFQSQEELQKINKSKQVYKDTIALIKLKMGKADTLIRQYNDKMKECDLLNEELAVVKNDKEDALKKYNQTMEKLTRIELSNSNYKESLENLKNLSENQKIKLDENEKHINQLLFKIKEIEQQLTTLQEYNKTLEQEIKSTKVLAKIATKKSVQLKHQTSQTLILRTQETSVNTDFIVTQTPKKLIMKDKNVATDKKEPFPIFCSKCDTIIEPAPVDQILKIMSSNPPLLSEFHSPPNSPDQNTLSEQVFEPTEMASFNIAKKDENNLESTIFSKKKGKCLMNTSKEKEYSSFMRIDSLNRKISKLEDLMKKVKKNGRKKVDTCCHQNCCSSKKNIKFIVQLPNQEEVFEYRKRKKLKQQNFGLSKRRLNTLKRQNLSDNKWKIESLKLKKKRKLPNTDLQSKKRLKKKKLVNQEHNDLFEYEKDLFSDNELLENYNCAAKSLSSPKFLESHRDSLSSNESMETHSDLAEKSIAGVNINQLNINSNIVSSIPESSQTSLSTVICPSNLEKENNKLSETSSAINKTSEKNEVFFSDCSIDLSIENKNTNGQLITTNNEENVEISFTPQLSNEIPVINVSVEQNEPFFIQNQNAPSVSIEKQFSDEEGKLLLSTERIDDNFTCSSNVKESQKFNTLANDENTLFDQLPHESATSSIEQTCKNFECENTHVAAENNYDSAYTESIKLKLLDSEKKNESPLYIEPLTDLPTTQDLPKMQIDSNNKLVVDDCLSDIQVESNVKQDISNYKMEYDNGDAIVSEESSEDCAQLPSQNVKISKCQILKRTATKKSTKITQKKKLLTIIRNIKKSSKRPISTNKLESSTSQITEKSRNASVESLNNSRSTVESTKQQPSTIENVPDGLPTKKQRIAHTPKTFTNSNDELKSVSIIENIESKVEKSAEKTTVASEKLVKSDDIFSLLKDHDETCKEQTETGGSFSLDPATLDNSLLLNTDKNIMDENTIKQEINGTTNTDCYQVTNDYSLENLSQDLKSNESQESFKLVKNYSDNTTEKSFIEEGNETEITDRFINERDTEVATKKNEEKIPTKELRSRQVIVKKNSSITKGKKLTKCQSLPKTINAENTCLPNSIIVTSLNDFIANSNNNTGTNKRKRIDTKENKINEKFIEEQLELLMQSEWTTEINSKIAKNLLDIRTLDIKTLAIFLIEFASEKISEYEELDKSHTPPAPLMTRSEQKLTVLILTINKIHKEFTDIFIEGIRFKLFRLGKPQLINVVERLFRILVVLNKIKKDREKVRIFLCDALYCLSMRAINIIFVALTSWAEVLPKCSSNNDILVKTIVHTVMTYETSRPFPKLSSLKKLLSTYYEYPNSGYKTSILKDELLQKLQENAAGVDTAVLLLCKKMGPDWSMENIIKGGLKQMIVSQTHPSLYEALNLLGNILRCTPKTDTSNNVGEIIDQLCDVLATNAGSDDLREGALSCLLSVGKFNYEKIARVVIQWQSSKDDLQVTTKEKLNSFFKLQGANWWWKFANTNFPLSKPDVQ